MRIRKPNVEQVINTRFPGPELRVGSALNHPYNSHDKESEGNKMETRVYIENKMHNIKGKILIGFSSTLALRGASPWHFAIAQIVRSLSNGMDTHHIYAFQRALHTYTNFFVASLWLGGLQAVNQ